MSTIYTFMGISHFSVKWTFYGMIPALLITLALLTGAVSQIRKYSTTSQGKEILDGHVRTSLGMFMHTWV
jgi:hypothetical protein